MLRTLINQVLSGRQRDPRSNNSLDGWVVRQVHKQTKVIHASVLFKILDEKSVGFHVDAHCRENDGELSSCPSSTDFVDFFTRPACLQIWAAISLCGRPTAEKIGIFCPRAIEFMVSILLMPVWIISSG